MTFEKIRYEVDEQMVATITLDDPETRNALEFLHHNLTLALSTEDIVEGVTAFFEKRDPVWRGR